MSSSLSHDQLKDRIRQYLETAWNGRGGDELASSFEQIEEHKQQEDGKSIDLLTDPLCVYLGAQRLPTSLAQARQTLRKTFPDIRLTITDLLVEDEKVAVRWMMRGTDLGGYKKYLPTGKSICITGMAMLHLENDSIKEEWVEIDIAGMLHQLGYISIPQPPRITIRRSVP